MSEYYFFIKKAINALRREWKLWARPFNFHNLLLHIREYPRQYFETLFMIVYSALMLLFGILLILLIPVLTFRWFFSLF